MSACSNNAVAVVTLRKEHPAHKWPTKKTSRSSCYDIHYQVSSPTREPKTILLLTGKVHILPTGLFIDKVEGELAEELQIRPRSGLATKGITVVNSPGTIDLDYKQEIMVILTNLSADPVIITEGDRIAQLKPVKCILDPETSVIEENERKGGFGSTGV